MVLFVHKYTNATTNSSLQQIKKIISYALKFYEQINLELMHFL